MSGLKNQKKARQKRITELVSESKIRTQADLLELLRLDGFRATQATISRDIKELHLARISGARSFKYAKLAKSYEAHNAEQIRSKINILKETVLGLNLVRNLAVVKCLSGSANMAGAAIDFLGESDVLGSVAGDDTALVILADDESALKFADFLKEIIGL